MNHRDDTLLLVEVWGEDWEILFQEPLALTSRGITATKNQYRRDWPKIKARYRGAQGLWIQVFRRGPRQRKETRSSGWIPGILWQLDTDQNKWTWL